MLAKKYALKRAAAVENEIVLIRLCEALFAVVGSDGAKTIEHLHYPTYSITTSAKSFPILVCGGLYRICVLQFKSDAVVRQSVHLVRMCRIVSTEAFAICC